MTELAATVHLHNPLQHHTVAGTDVGEIACLTVNVDRGIEYGVRSPISELYDSLRRRVQWAARLVQVMSSESLIILDIA
jgi:hypothetical protein